ncbi:hypothetical protein Pint_22461 [Pistacia integerrima]|uniref:Uncharacterized protein n=1 Tax=Pistacia integerrima TaxID=434235 RepID=A0ACC0YPB8_9ROSI|nr:hypothetical protein Pint_22461 [Pistacia integerrima]
MSNNRSSRGPESYTMNGGHGAYSYSNNSFSQRAGIEAAMEIIDEAISKELHLPKLSLPSNALSIVDLGCSTGPNTFMALQNIIDSIKQKYQSLTLLKFLNSWCTLTIVHRMISIRFSLLSLQTVHWLSKVPEECLDKNSLAWNKGRVHYTNARSEVYVAYAAQFAEDMGNSRAKEIVVGGLMVLILSGIESGMCHSRQPAGLIYDLLGASLKDLANKHGEVGDDEVQSDDGCPTHKYPFGDDDAQVYYGRYDHQAFWLRSYG